MYYYERDMKTGIHAMLTVSILVLNRDHGGQLCDAVGVCWATVENILRLYWVLGPRCDVACSNGVLHSTVATSDSHLLDLWTCSHGNMVVCTCHSYSSHGNMVVHSCHSYSSHGNMVSDCTYLSFI